MVGYTILDEPDVFDNEAFERFMLVVKEHPSKVVMWRRDNGETVKIKEAE